MNIEDVAGDSLPSAAHGPRGLAATGTGQAARIFCILTIFRKKEHVWTLKNFNSIFRLFARRHSLWRRGNTARRYMLWRRGT
jgi:hypothetical protein